MDRLWKQCSNLAQQGYTPQQIDQALAPFTFDKTELVRMLSHDGGSKNLQAATAYMDRLIMQRLALAQQGQTAEQIDQTLAPFTLDKKELVRMLSRPGASKQLENL